MYISEKSNIRFLRVNSSYLKNNFVAGVERLAYRIQGETCGTQNLSMPSGLINMYANNEAHSVMSGVNLWPTDKGFTYDRREFVACRIRSLSLSSFLLECVLIKGFK
jgi:hypothetical protein